MKRLALVFLTVSPILAIFTSIIHEVHMHVDLFDALYPAIGTYLKFHQLSFVIGLLLLALSVSKKIDKIFLFLISCFLLIQVILNELKVISLFSWSHTWITCLFLSFLSIYIKFFDKFDYLTSKYVKNITLSAISIYFLVVLSYTFFKFDFTYYLIVYTLIYSSYQYGLFNLFKTWYISEFSHSHHVFLE